MKASLQHLIKSRAAESSGHEVSNRCVMRIRGLRKAFGGQVVLDDASADLHEGEVVLLMGPNGSGKTTLLNCLTGNLEPDAGRIELFTNGTEEHFHFPRSWWRDLNPLDHFLPERVAREGVGRTWQEVRLFPSQSLRENILLAAPKQLGESPLFSVSRPLAVRAQERQIANRADAVLAQLGMQGREGSSADRISLGQTKRVAIARAVEHGSKILFLDEPLAGLDADGIGVVLEMLLDFAQSQKITLVIVEHLFNIPYVLDWATTVWSLNEGRLIVRPPSAVREELRSLAGNGVHDLIQRVAGRGFLVQETALPGGALFVQSFPSGQAQDSAPILEIVDLVIHRGQRLVIGERMEDGKCQGLSLSLRAGVGFLLAPNGWGKTTLFQAIAGLIPITRGSLSLGGVPIQKLTPWERVNAGLSLLQARDNAFPSLTVRETFRLLGGGEMSSTLASLLPKRMSDLSGGERQRVALTCLEYRKRPLQLLDEPFASLDNEHVSHFADRVLSADGGIAKLVALPYRRERNA
jgi:ABC-type branched-subunit amino acid transport system ATPase component